ncbi:MAG: response regulator transcription factor [Candidatus Hydrogenedentes bacterium]|nr:response regulator transcription factor [Candidatus Hydrogenedentota bacterium]
MTGTRPIRLLVADDHQAVRKSIVRLMSQFDDMEVTAEAVDGGEALQKIRTEEFDLVILDITMPVKNGLEVLREIKRDNPNLPVVMLSIHPADEYKTQAIALGAAGYVTKDRAADDLIDELRRAVNR